MNAFQRPAPEPDAELVPISDAATVMVVSDRPDLHVLMVQRTRRMAFGAGAWVFPGGRVDQTDKEFIGLVDGLTDEHASTMLDLTTGGVAWWLAAVRETAEEAGILLACEACTPEQLALVRAAAESDQEDEFFHSLSAHELRLDLSTIHEVARFITPLGPPRRFDTRFFVAEAPLQQTVSHDPNELDGAQWIRPSDAMRLWRTGDLELMSVTFRMLACLARHETVDELMGAAASRPPAQQVRVNDPAGSYEVLLPGDAGYEDADLEVEHGWVRI